MTGIENSCTNRKLSASLCLPLLVKTQTQRSEEFQFEFFLHITPLQVSLMVAAAPATHLQL